MLRSVTHIWTRAGVPSLLAVVCFFVPVSASACGLNWSEPRSHFEGVSFQGYVFLVENLGEVDAGKGLTFPLRAIFRSESSGVSPYIGSGWDIPLIESHLVQLDEWRFKMVEPTGWYRIFWRDRKNPSVLHGQNGWKAEIRANQVTAWADCGSKLVFNKGRIVSMQIQERRFDYSYDGNQLSTIKEGGSVILSIEKETTNGGEIGLRMANDHLVRFKKGQRPQVQVIAGQKVIGGMSESLSAITLRDGSKRLFHYAVNENLYPTIKINERNIIWDPIEKNILKDGEWIYDIQPAAIPHGNAAISRRNAINQREHWHYDSANGKETTLSIDGISTTRTWFTTGKLNGKNRRITQSIGGRSHILEEYSYNENGELIREVNNGVKLWYLDDISKLREQLKDNKTIAVQKDKSGEVEKMSSSWFDTVVQQTGSGSTIVTNTENSIITRVVDKQGRLVKIIRADKP